MAVLACLLCEASGKETQLSIPFLFNYPIPHRVTGWAGSNSVVFGEYILIAANQEVTRWNQRGIGLACITAAFLIHGFSVKWGLRLQNLIGGIKLVIVLIIIVAGWAALGGALKIDKPDNFSNAFSGTTASGYGIVTALYNVIWSYIGYSLVLLSGSGEESC